MQKSKTTYCIIHWMRSLREENTWAVFRNVQSSQIYWAMFASEDEPVDVHRLWFDLILMSNWILSKQDFARGQTWLAPDFGKVSQTSIGKVREGSCLCISLNLDSIALCFEIIFIWVMLKKKFVGIPALPSASLSHSCVCPICDKPLNKERIHGILEHNDDSSGWRSWGSCPSTHPSNIHHSLRCWKEANSFTFVVPGKLLHHGEQVFHWTVRELWKACSSMRGQTKIQC